MEVSSILIPVLILLIITLMIGGIMISIIVIFVSAAAQSTRAAEKKRLELEHEYRMQELQASKSNPENDLETLINQINAKRR